MNAAASPRPILRRWWRRGIVAVVLVALVAWLLQPPRATGFLLDRAGDALGLRITASGDASYRLRGTPQLVLHDVVAQRPGDPAALLRAGRIFISLPWRTIRAGGDDLTAQRIELDAPVLDVPALQRWLASRPPSETRIPTLRDGLRITRGRIDNDDWTIDGIDVALPSLSPSAPVRAKLRGHYLDAPTRIPFDFDVAMTKPANDAGIAATGVITIEDDGWRLPARVQLSGPLHLGNDEVRMQPAKFGIAARYVSGTTDMPFAIGAHGPLLFDEAVWSLAPASLVLRGGGPIPDARARGALALGRRLVLRLDGAIAAWPGAWPALPPPLSASTSPLPFALDYAGHPDLRDGASLQLQRDQTRLDARFKLPEVLRWIGAGAQGSPLPPLQGRLRTPQLEVSGARLSGVEVELGDE